MCAPCFALQDNGWEMMIEEDNNKELLKKITKVHNKGF
jgi:hypothetical protein